MAILTLYSGSLLTGHWRWIYNLCLDHSLWMREGIARWEDVIQKMLLRWSIVLLCVVMIWCLLFGVFWCVSTSNHVTLTVFISVWPWLWPFHLWVGTCQVPAMECMLQSLVLIAQAVFLRECGHTHTHSHRCHWSPYPHIGYHWHGKIVIHLA